MYNGKLLHLEPEIIPGRREGYRLVDVVDSPGCRTKNEVAVAGNFDGLVRRMVELLASEESVKTTYILEVPFESGEIITPKQHETLDYLLRTHNVLVAIRSKFVR